ncbi:MAG TPA: lipopolysaccharide kinase InaA family protein [Pirellulales bacterium]|jgi:heptose I phosphotransferase|nr:lipopolysaccharide kinase InaA family protein [Pirellulales bacterium]
MPHDDVLWIAPGDDVALARAGLGSFDDFMQHTPGRMLRAVESRENWRLDLSHADGRPRGAFLKKHRVRGWLARMRRSDGRVEAENIRALEHDRIATMRLIAYGQRLGNDGQLESFVLTEELAGFTQLDHYLRQRFVPRNPSDARRQHGELRTLLARVAALARRFHDHGYNHRDFYCCHFFIRESSSGEFQVHLIDLQRAQRRRWLRGRWIVKDLAQLSYSAPRERIGRSERLAFIKQYLGVQRLGPRDKRLIRRVLAKHARMERRLGPHP